MKKCFNCNKKYSNDFVFCNSCGAKLKTNSENNIKVCQIVLIISITCCLTFSYIKYEQTKFDDVKSSVEDYKMEKYLADLSAQVYTSDILITDFNWYTSENYFYIEGLLKNVGDNTISYLEIGADFLDNNGSVIDSDWTNDGNDIRPGDSRTFSFMHKYNSSVKDIELYIKKVS